MMEELSIEEINKKIELYYAKLAEAEEHGDDYLFVNTLNKIEELKIQRFSLQES